MQVEKWALAAADKVRRELIDRDRMRAKIMNHIRLKMNNRVTATALSSGNENIFDLTTLTANQD